LWLHSLKVAQLLRSAACLHTNQSRSYLNHLVYKPDMYVENDIHIKYKILKYKDKNKIKDKINIAK